MSITDQKYQDPGTNAEARAKRFVYDWMMDMRYVPEGERTIACSRALFEAALAEEFDIHAEAVRRQIEVGK